MHLHESLKHYLNKKPFYKVIYLDGIITDDRCISLCNRIDVDKQRISAYYKQLKCEIRVEDTNAGLKRIKKEKFGFLLES